MAVADAVALDSCAAVELLPFVVLALGFTPLPLLAHVARLKSSSLWHRMLLIGLALRLVWMHVLSLTAAQIEAAGNAALSCVCIRSSMHTRLEKLAP